jgi:hypothetical protein
VAVPASLPGSWRPQCGGTQLHGGSAHWCDFSLPVLCHGSVAVPASLPGCWRPQCGGLSCMAGPLTDSRCRATSRQRGGPGIPSWGLATTVWGTQLHGWSPHSCDSRCSCYVTAAWRSQHPFLGAGDHSVGELSCMAGPLTDVISRCSCFVTAAWRSQHPFLGAGDHSVGDSAAWLVPSLV